MVHSFATRRRRASVAAGASRSSRSLGYGVVGKACPVHDLHASSLHHLGICPDAFSVRCQGLDAKLADVDGARLLEEIVA